MAKSFDELRRIATQIRDEQGIAKNTAKRLGQAMLDNIDKLQQEYPPTTELTKTNEKVTELETSTNEKLASLSNKMAKNATIHVNQRGSYIFGEYIKINGDLDVLASVNILKFKVKENEIYRIIGSWDGGVARQYAIYNSETTFDASTLIAIGDVVKTSYDTGVYIPNGAKTLLVQCYKKDSEVLTSISESMIAAIANEVTSYQLDAFPKIAGKYINRDGSLGDLSSVSLTKININNEGLLRIIGSWDGGVARQYAVYNSDTIFDASTLIAIGDVVKSSYDTWFDLPMGAKTVLIQNSNKLETKIFRAATKDELIKLIENRMIPLKESIQGIRSLIEGEENIVNLKTQTGYIGLDGVFVTSTSCYCPTIKVNTNDVYKITRKYSQAPIRNAASWALYSSDSVFNASTLIEVSPNNARSDSEEIIHIKQKGYLLIQSFYNLPAKQVKLISKLDKLEDANAKIENEINRISDVWNESALLTKDPKQRDVLFSSIKYLQLYGLPADKEYIISQLSHIDYNGPYLTLEISSINGDKLKKEATFSGGIDVNNKYQVYRMSLGSELPIMEGLLYIDGTSFNPYLGANFIKVDTVTEDTYAEYGIKPNCIVPTDRNYESALTPDCPYDRLRREIVRIAVKDIDLTRDYVLKTFSYDKATELCTLQLCTKENFLTTFLIQEKVPKTDAYGIKRVGTRDVKYVDVNFDIANGERPYSYNANNLEEAKRFPVYIDGFQDSEIIAEEELELTLDGEPLKLQDCGVISKKFYLTSGTTIYSAETINKSIYTTNDVGVLLKKVYKFEDATDDDYIDGIHALKELNNGNLLINVNIKNSATDPQHFKNRSEYYLYNWTTCERKFAGSWAYYSFADGVVAAGGYWTTVWDFDQYNDLVFVSERCAQGLGGRAWMSKDGGNTWYVIFNAFGYSNYEKYPFVLPSGWDSTIPDKPDFSRPNPNVPSNPTSNFHIHGITYDRYRNQVLIVSGDATGIKGSYTAVWICKDFMTASLYPAKEYNGKQIPAGGTAASNPVKMLNCNWKRVGLCSDENAVAKNLQFVSAIAFPDRICFGSDCGGGGINGILQVTQPDNIVGSNISVNYPLNADAENSLTHSASGWLKLPSLPYLWSFHREGSGFNPAISSDQRGAILASNDGKQWIRVWIDDTLDEDRKTKISWGCAIIGKLNEMYLRYKGASPKDNVIRRIRYVE